MDEAKRARLIVFDITLRKAQLLGALEDIARQQVACKHAFNPWIKGGWWDRSDVRVCGKCGLIEKAASTVPAPQEK